MMSIAERLLHHQTEEPAAMMIANNQALTALVGIWHEETEVYSKYWITARSVAGPDSRRGR